MNTLIVTGGNIERDFALAFIKKQKTDCLIAADKGLEFLDEAGIRPDYIVGDFDSGRRELAQTYRLAGTEVREFRPEKDFTDTEIAVRLAVEKGGTNITVLGATGTRIDHVLGSIRNLSIAMKAGADCCLIDSRNRIRMTEKPLTIRKDEQYGKYVSLLAHGGTVKNLTLRGFFYPLTDYCMTADDAIGISNEIVEEEARITFESGSLLVIESKD